jgi:hypothetical protein
MDTNDWNAVGHLFGALFRSMLCAVGPESSAIACDSLRADANDLAKYPELRRIIWCVLDGVDPVPDDHSEYAQIVRASEADEHRSKFKLIEGGHPTRGGPFVDTFPNASMEDFPNAS